MKLKAGNKIIPLFEKKKTAPVQKPSFSGTRPNFPRTNQPFQKSIRPKPMMPGTKPNYPGQKPVFKPSPSIHPGFGTNTLTKKEKSKDITKIIANLPRDELAAYVSIIAGLIFISIAIIIW